MDNERELIAAVCSITEKALLELQLTDLSRVVFQVCTPEDATADKIDPEVFEKWLKEEEARPEFGTVSEYFNQLVDILCEKAVQWRNETALALEKKDGS